VRHDPDRAGLVRRPAGGVPDARGELEAARGNPHAQLASDRQTRRQVEMADRAGVAALRSFCRGGAYAGYCLTMSLATLRNTSLSLNWRLRALYGFGQVRGVFRRPLDGY
jgi:hypothetical protein